MAQACAKVLPEGRSRAGVVRREEQGEHEDEAAETCGTHQDTENQRNSNRQFAIGHQKGDARGVWKNKAAQNGRHERISPALQELIDPELKAAVKCKCGAENFVLLEDQEKNPHTDTDQGKRSAVADTGIRRKIHRHSHSTVELPLPRYSREG